MPDFDNIDDLVKSGPRRLQDAEELMQFPTHNAQRSDAPTRHLRGAMYLAGYGVECLLKAYIIEQEGCRTLTEAQNKINERRKREGAELLRDIAGSAAGHSIDYLLRLTDLSDKYEFDIRLWGRLAQWKSFWRYDPNPATRQEAEVFLTDILAAINWLKPKVFS